MTLSRDSDPELLFQADTIPTTGLYYRRKFGLIANPLKRLLGPLPKNYVGIDSTANYFPRQWARWQVAVAIATIAITWTLAVLLMINVPWMGYSIIRMLMIPFDGVSGDGSPVPNQIYGGFMIALGVVMVVAQLAAKRKMRAFWLEAALTEEQDFRTGAEAWNLWQRTMSCVAFGTAHLLNLIYPLGVIVALMFTGAVLMAVYLHVYRKTDSVYWATAESSKVHALYNEIAIYWMGVTILLLGALALFS